MNILECTGMAVKTLAANKLRSSLTMLGMIIGTASVIALIGIGEGAQNFMLGKLESFGANRLIVMTSREETEGVVIQQEPTLVLSDAEALRTSVPAITEVAPMISANLPIVRGNRQISTLVSGTTPEMTSVLNIPVASGRFFDRSQQQLNARVVALGPEAARKLFGSVSPIGQEVLINNLSFRVIGIMQVKGSLAIENPDEFVYIPITTMANQIVGRTSAYGIPIDNIQVTARDKSSIRAAAFQINNVLTQRHGQKDITVVASQAFLNLIGQITGAMSLLLGAVAAISLLVGGIGIMNIMLVSVTERTQEIGLRKAIGASRQDILAQFIIEAVMLSIAGGLVGTTLGIGGATAVGMVTPLEPSVPLGAIAVAVSVSGGIGIIFGVIPAHRAAKLDPIVALRSN